MIQMFRDFDYENKPVVDIVNEMIIDAINKKASDIHFDPTEDYLNVRIRVDGELLEYAKVPAFVKKNLLTRIKIISGMNITESRLPQDGAIKNLSDQIDLDLRVSSLPIVDGEKIVIRILNYTMSSSGLENLGLSEKNLEKINKLIKMPNGIILVAGATGSGKSTTVYSILQILNTVSKNIITVEDPVEMKIEGINQVQVMSDIGLTFGATLRSILRQDPDIIMIGEIRDDETARIAVRASITGHLVLSTIHTNNSLNTIERLLDMEVERYLLASALEGIISQKLARKLCDKCKKKRPTSDYEKEIFRKVFDMDVNEVYMAVGCEECGNGYKGRIALHEVLLITQEIRDAISNNMPKSELRTLVYNSDVNTLLQDGLEKVINGYTTFEEVIKLIELDDDIEDKKASSSYRYDLNRALEQTQLSKTTQLNLNAIKKAAAPTTQNQIFKDDANSLFKDEQPVQQPVQQQTVKQQSQPVQQQVNHQTQPVQQKQAINKVQVEPKPFKETEESKTQVLDI